MVATETAAEIRRQPGLAHAPVTILADASPMFEQHSVDTVPRTFYYNGQGQPTAKLEGFDPAEFEDIARQLEGEKKR
jgi:hypothetical protein